MEEVPKIVSQRLHAAVKDEIHPDPDLIAAFVERSLGKQERVQVLEHLSRCVDCRQVVSLSAAQPDITGADSAVPASTGWLSWPVLRWGAAVACVVVVGAAVTLRYHQETQQATPTSADGRATEEARLQAPDSALAKKTTSLQLRDQEAKAAILSKQPTPPAQTIPSPAMQPSLRVPAASGSMFAATANRQTTRTASRAEGAAPGPVEMADAGTGSRLAEEVPVRAKSALPAAQDVQINGSAAALGGNADVAITPLVSTNLPPRWTLSSDGTLQRSRDSGRSWQTIAVSGKIIFRALAANGLDIWVGGLAGTLFHSSDAGQHWTQVRPAADGETLADDIIGVEFTDLQHGKLTTSSTETWITADAGQTWQKQ
jgi:hypothetical protein